MSAAARPTTTADGAIGMERKRSVTPRSASAATFIIVPSRPKNMFSASIPGMRKSK